MTAAPTDVPPQGFWKIAEANPEQLALVDPDERRVSAGELLASCNQLVARPARPRAEAGRRGRDAAAERRRGVRVVPRGHARPASTSSRSTGTSSAPRSRTSSSDCEAKVFVAHERFAEHAIAAADEIDFPAEGRFAVGGDIPGFRAYDELKAGQSDATPADRTTGIVMNYTSGTTGRPKGVRRHLPGTDPEAGGRGFGGMLTLFGLQPFDGNVHIVGSPLYHTAVLVFAGSRDPHGPHRRGHGQVDARADAAS